MKNSNDRKLIYMFFIVLIVLCTINAYAQKIEIGGRIMPSVSSINMKTSSGGTVKGEVTLGFGAGAFLGLYLSNHLGLQGEIIYNSFSQKYKDVNMEQKINLRYVNIPVLLSLNTGKSNPVNLNIVAGPQVGLNVGSNIETSGSNGTENVIAVLAVRKSDLGLAYGAGLDFGLNASQTCRLGIGFRGVYGLVDISDNSNTIITDSYYILDRTHLETYSVYLGFSLLF